MNTNNLNLPKPTAWRWASGLITSDQPKAYNAHDQAAVALAKPLFTLEQLQAVVEAERTKALEDAAVVVDGAYDVFFTAHAIEFKRQRYDQVKVKRAIQEAVEFATADAALAIRALKVTE